MELRDLFISKVRVKLLQVFFDDPNELYYVRQLVRKTGEEINAVRRELGHLEKAGLLKKEPRGNRLYYWLNKTNLLYADLASMVAKTASLGHEILKNRTKLGKISYALLSGKFVKRISRREDEVDLLVVGEVVMPELAALVKAEENRRKQEINYTVMTSEEFAFRKRRRDPFLLSILNSSKIIIIGEEEKLLETSLG
jgi:hypothetical protein